MKIYFTRHGESEANLLREFSNRGSKHGLTAKGREQATLLAQKLKPLSVSKLYASPLLRAVQTAEILAETLACPYEITDSLREYDCGVLEGHSDAAGWDIYEIVLQDWLAHGYYNRRIEGGESFLDMQARFVPFIENLLQEHRQTEAHLVLVGHGGLYRCMLPLVLTNIDFNFTLQHSLGHTGYVLAESRAEGLYCLQWDEIELPEGGKGGPL
jgi:broad specificity phosphatase PhoE